MPDMLPGMPALESTASFSACGTYRYDLTRHWGDDPMVVWVLLNPSTADAERDDPTIRRCIGFAKQWGHGGLVVLNLFALRSTDPKALYHHPDPVGPDNDATITRWLDRDDVRRVVVAWGAHGALHDRYRAFAELALATRRIALRRAQCLGRTQKGQPRHPLYLAADTELET